MVLLLLREDITLTSRYYTTFVVYSVLDKCLDMLTWINSLVKWYLRVNFWKSILETNFEKRMHAARPVQISNKGIYNNNNTTIVPMPLSQLAGVSNFVLIWSHHISGSYASSLLKSYLSRSLFMHSSHDFLGWPFFLFPVISSSITSHIWEFMSRRLTWPNRRRRLKILISSIFATPTLSRRTSVDTLSTSLSPHIILVIRCSTLRNLPSSATVSSPMFHNSTTKLAQHNTDKSSPVASKINRASRLTYHLTPWTFSKHYQFSHVLPQMLHHNN